MTFDEFNSWFTFHASCFTGVNGWLAKAARDLAVDPKEIKKRWYSSLADVSLEDAKAASLRMHSGVLEEPKGFDRHPAAIRRACLASRPVRYDSQPDYSGGEPTYQCGLCLDSGWVCVVHTQSVRLIAKGAPTPTGSLHSAVVPCNCDVGAKRCRALSHRSIQWPQYTPDGFCRLRIGSVANCDETVNSVKEWLSTRKPANYVHEFDAWK